LDDGVLVGEIPEHHIGVEACLQDADLIAET
jgi:hypothetical protein